MRLEGKIKKRVFEMFTSILKGTIMKKLTREIL